MIYRVFGLNIESELALPELLPGAGAVDVRVVYGAVPAGLSEPVEKTPWLEIGSGQFLLRVDGIAGYYVENGCSIVIEPEDKAASEALRLFLLDSVFAALLQQRSILALHAAAVVVDGGKAVVLAGNSCSGKTALAMALMDRGGILLADEVCALTCEDGKVYAMPGWPRLGVWQDTLKTAGKDYSALQPLRAGLCKYHYPVAGQFAAQPAELSQVYLLHHHNLPAIAPEKLRGAMKLENLLQQSFCESAAVDRKAIFKVYKALSALPVTRLNYNIIPGNAEELAGYILREGRE